ncbi:DUF3857 domain-containing protein [Altibacter sp. HG106]|uniref:DUF3857 domain-containing protein n=1 Tax=Altibacter sp. HG106 TaxID=3023937 RepID=UPI00234FF903|nr:DUF3857 domain-containing protein [Altibacter sp. HG106]MDC7994400.1 DUF3857 domain-containing protein [Altibacter sp. HG106]
MKPFTILFFLGLIVSTSAHAQDYEFGEVSKEELEMTTYAKDSTAHALILRNYRNTYYDYEQNTGWVLYTEVHKRIKILDKEGLDYGTFKINLYKSGSTEEELSRLRAYTYNLENGKVEDYKMKRENRFKTEVSDSWDQMAISMPNVKEGSVVEISYTLVSPFASSIDDVIIQEDIPTLSYHAEIKIPQYFNTRRMVKGNFNVNPNDSQRRRNVSFKSGGGTANIAVNETVHEYRYKDIPALKEESYVDNINNYRYSIAYEIISVENYSGGIKKLATTWEEVAKTINDSKYFGDEIKRTRLLKDDAEAIKAAHTGAMERMYAAFDFVKNHMTWNGSARLYSYNGVVNAYKEKTGNSADINLMLVGLLKECGLDASPVLVSTKDHGIPLFPTREGFNYVVAAANINNTYYLLDATEKYAAPNVLPTRVLNWFGFMVNEDGSSRQMTLYPAEKSKQSIMMNASLDEEGGLHGQQRVNYTLSEALQFRAVNEGAPQTQKTESLMEAYGMSDVSAWEVDNMDDPYQPVTESFEFEIDEAAEVIGNDIYFSPLFFLKMDNNPFVQETREYPIDYAHPFVKTTMVTVTIPEGYEVTSLPEPINLALPEGMGTFRFMVQNAQGNINIRTTFTINKSIVPSFHYPYIKEFYKQRVDKENEKVVLSKV